MKRTIILISEAGRGTAERIGGEICALGDLQAHWNSGEVIIFIGAMGICVRSIAPLITDKHSDPAVICVDSMGKSVIPVLSGHVGGANDAAREIALRLNAYAAITTLSDGLGLWPLDTIAKRFGWVMADNHINRQIALFTSCKPTALLLDVEDEGTRWMVASKPPFIDVCYNCDDIDFSKYALLIAVSPRIIKSSIPLVHYIPPCLHLGIGLAHQASPAVEIREEIFSCLAANGLSHKAISSISTIDLKRDEPVVHLLEEEGYTIRFYTSEELNAVDVPTPSEVVAKHVGTASVCEAAALLSSSGGSLILPKQKGAKWTLAVANSLDHQSSLPPSSLIEFVGAGPGDPDLISVRGRRLLESADLILYAGSLVPKAVTACAKPSAAVVSSASMSLEEQVALMKTYYDKGAFIVRLHTGDPCLYGAIQEQMNILDRYGMKYHITPGISAFQAAAAELKSQFTIPRRTQTIILTRGEGRTPMPEREKLHLLARSRSTMCIYLSADIVEKVEEELLQEYPADTPVAVCYRLTWPEQAIFRGVLKDLTTIVRGNGLSLDTLIVVGEAIDNREGLSELYSEHFSHLYRSAKK